MRELPQKLRLSNLISSRFNAVVYYLFFASQKTVAQKIIDGAMTDGATAMNVPGVVNAVRQGTANAGIAYYSAAVDARGDVDIVRFPETVNLSEAIRNAAVVPGTARNVDDALEFVSFLVTPEAQVILRDTGQPPVVPPIRRGAVPAAIR